MRKEINLSDELMQEIRVLAAHDRTNSKKYIECVIIAHLSEMRSKKKNKK